MLALINLIIRRTRLAFRTPARLALFPLLSQSGCFILQLPTGFYSRGCGRGSELARQPAACQELCPQPPDGSACGGARGSGGAGGCRQRRRGRGLLRRGRGVWGAEGRDAPSRWMEGRGVKGQLDPLGVGWGRLLP